MRFIIQSERSAEYVEQRVLKFIEDSGKLIEAMDDETFKNNVEALSTLLLEKPKTTTAQARTYWSEITSLNYRFERNIKNERVLQTVTKADVLAFYASKIAYGGPERKQFSVWVQPGPDAPPPPKKAKEEESIKEVATEASSAVVGGEAAGTAADAADAAAGDVVAADATAAEGQPFELLPVVEIKDVLKFQYGLGLYPIPTADEHPLVE